MDKKIQLFQIFFDEKTKASIDPDFIPMDNTSGPAHLFERYPICNYIDSVDFDDNEWVGFFSPKFFQKTLLRGSQVRNIVNEANPDIEVHLFSSFWTHAAVWPNVWVQGESAHPGLLKISQKLAEKCGYELDLKNSLNTLETAVFSNFFVATRSFWLEWRRAVRIYSDMCINDHEISSMKVSYHGNKVDIHTFVVERIASMILLTKKYRTSFHLQAYDRQFSIKTEEGNFAFKMHLCKKEFIETREPNWLAAYDRLVTEYNENLVTKT